MQDINTVRNVALFGHGKCGKTSLAEALLFTSGKTKRLGKVDDGSSVMDYEPEEINRHLTISSSFHQYSWKKHSVFVTDTPGDDNFLNDTLYASRIADSGIFIVGAVLGVKNQTEKIADFVARRKLPCLIYINKMDRERANFDNTIAEVKEKLPFKPAIVQIPIGAEEKFKGIVDLVTQKAYMFDSGDTGKVKESDIPGDVADIVAQYRESLMEMVAETDDGLIEKFLEEGELEEADLLKGLIEGTKSGAIHPVCVGAALPNKGTETLLNRINDLLPSPAERPTLLGTDPKTKELVERKPLPDEPFSAQVFKTMADPYAGTLTIFRVFSGTLKGDTVFNANKDAAEKVGQLLSLEGKSQNPVDSAGPGMIVAVAKLKGTSTGDTLCDAKAPIVYDALEPMPYVISYAVAPAKKGDEEKLFSSIAKMLDEDPTLKLIREEQTGELLLSGVGQIHIEVTCEKVKRKYGNEMSLSVPKIPYKETIKGKARVQGKHKKQTGGHGQYADSWIEIEPMPRSGGFEFVDKIVGGVIPRQYIPAVEKGVLEAMQKGVLAGYPMVDIRVSLVDGSFHAVDSSEMAFKISGSMAFKKGAQEAKPVLLEPIMNMTIKVTKDNVGDIIGDLNGRRGKVMGMDSDQESKREIISAQAPMAEIQQYAADITSITGGRGTFSVEFSHYEELPAQLADKVIEAAKQENP